MELSKEVNLEENDLNLYYLYTFKKIIYYF